MDIITNAFAAVISTFVKVSQANIAFVMRMGVVCTDTIDNIPLIYFFFISDNSFSLFSSSLLKKYSSHALSLISLIN